MKTLIMLYALLCLCNTAAPQSDAICGNTDFPWIDETIPHYLKPGFGQQQTMQLAILYVDFPDGRLNGTDQIFTQQQLNDFIAASGELDAVAELGCEKINNVLQLIPAKYTYFDRWELYFSQGTYHGGQGVHPDFNAYGETAFGSFKEYYDEVSNSKLIIDPAVTHPEETDLRLKTGIINRVEDVNGRKIIKSIKLNKNKYGSSFSNSYFLTKNVADGEYHDALASDAYAMLEELYNNNEIDFDITNYEGEVLIVFAGGQGYIGGQTFDDCITARSTYNLFYDTTKWNRMDGLPVAVHEFGHVIGFGHINGGRYCPMNLVAVRHDLDCPSHFNPIYKLQKGWLDATVYRTSQTVTNLPPIETSHECAIVTMIGSPGTALDYSTGEYYVLENRRTTGFDTKLLEDEEILLDFKGGMLVWHYSPYFGINPDPCGGGQPPPDKNKQIEDPNGENVNFCYGNGGNPLNFYGYMTNIGSQYFNILSSKSKTANQISTGIEIKNIASISSTTNSGMSFDIDYTLGEPPAYDYVIYNRNQSNVVKNLSGSIYYHSQDLNEYYIISPSTVIDVRPGQPFKTGAIIAEGEDGRNIVFRGAGYDNNRDFVSSVIISASGGYSTVNELSLDYIEIQNPFSDLDLSISSNDNTIPININNLFLYSSSSSFPRDIEIGGSGTGAALNSVFIDNYKVNFSGDLLINTSNEFHNNDIIIPMGSNLLFSNNVKWDLYDSHIRAIVDRPEGPILFGKQSSATYWSGLNLYNSIIEFDAITFKNSEYGLLIDEPKDNSSVLNSTFENNTVRDINITNNIESEAIVEITGNIMNCSNTQASSISSYDMSNIVIENNQINNSRGYGIVVLYNVNPLVKGNEITGDNNAGFSAGILSYSSDGFYDCNVITNCNDYGMILDNSSPYLFSNNIYGNGIGLYLANYSYPVMSPIFLPSQTIFNAGINKIHNNGSEEIYGELNATNDANIPIMEAGENIIYDANPNGVDILIHNQYFGNPANVINAQENYWGGDEPIDRFDPAGCADYSNYLSEEPSFSCNVESFTENNSSMSQEYLLFGEARSSFLQNNYSSAISNYNSLLYLPNTEINPVIVLNNILTANLISEGDLSNLQSFYENYSTSNNSDTSLYRRARDLAIETKVQRLYLNDAIGDYEDIITTSSDSTEILYANVNKLRALSLLLDSLTQIYGGDNPGVTAVYNSAVESINKLNMSEEKVSKHEADKLNWLNLIVNEKMSNFDLLVDKQKNELLKLQMLKAITTANLKYGIADKTSKLEYMKPPANVVRSYYLSNNYPNPFNPVTSIEFAIQKNEFVNLSIYDISGRKVAQLVNENKKGGQYKISFNGSTLASGVYFYRISAGSFVQTKRMMLIK